MTLPVLEVYIMRNTLENLGGCMVLSIFSLAMDFPDRLAGSAKIQGDYQVPYCSLEGGSRATH